MYADQPRADWDAEKTWAATRIRVRHMAVNPLVERASEWPSTTRTERYLSAGLELGVEAAEKALAEAGVGVKDVGLVAVASSTVPSTQNPGLEMLISRALGVRPSARRLRLGPIGCHAALPLLTVGSDFVQVTDAPALVLAVELSSVLAGSLAVNDRQQVVAHALFGDAAGAAVIGPSTHAAGALTIVDSTVVTVDEHADLLTWGPEDEYGGLKMLLSLRLPATVGKYLEPTVSTLLARHGMSLTDVAHWAVHPGGPDILSVVQRKLGLADGDLSPSWQVLAENGNCSSATILLIMRHVMTTRTVTAGEFMVGVAFGPGLTLAVTLFRVT